MTGPTPADLHPDRLERPAPFAPDATEPRRRALAVARDLADKAATLSESDVPGDRAASHEARYSASMWAHLAVAEEVERARRDLIYIGDTLCRLARILEQEPRP